VLAVAVETTVDSVPLNPSMVFLLQEETDFTLEVLHLEVLGETLVLLVKVETTVDFLVELATVDPGVLVTQSEELEVTPVLLEMVSVAEMVILEELVMDSAVLVVILPVLEVTVAILVATLALEVLQDLPVVLVSVVVTLPTAVLSPVDMPVKSPFEVCVFQGVDIMPKGFKKLGPVKLPETTPYFCNFVKAAT